MGCSEQGGWLLTFTRVASRPPGRRLATAIKGSNLANLREAWKRLTHLPAGLSEAGVPEEEEEVAQRFVAVTEAGGAISGVAIRACQ